MSAKIQNKANSALVTKFASVGFGVSTMNRQHLKSDPIAICQTGKWKRHNYQKLLSQRVVSND
jgi:hypothetical protein